jgi:outer membrane lipoprotein-sorting protein
LKGKLLRLFILSSIFPLIFLGCVPSKPTDEVEILPSERLINKLEINRRRIKSFEGNGTITVRSGGVNQSVSFKVVLQKPDSLYLTMFGPFGIELAQALVMKDNFVFYDAINNTAYEGDVDSDILTRIFKVNLSFNELMDAFIGSVNLTDNLYRPPEKYTIDYDQYVLTYIDSNTERRTVYRVDIRELGITDYQVLNSNGDALLEGKYSKFELFENVAVPSKIELQNNKDNQRVSIDYKNMVVNKRSIVIDFKIPDDANIVKW